MCVSTHLYLHKHVSNDMDICFFKRGKKHKHFENYLFVNLFKQNETNDIFLEDSIIQKKSDKIIDEEAFF